MSGKDQQALTLHCPLEGVELRGNWCPVSTCMFNMDNKCRHSEMSNTHPEEFLEKEGLLEEAQRQVERIKNLIYLDSYIQHVTSKTALNGLSKRDFDRLLDEETYNQWPGSAAGNFPVIEKLLTKRNDYHG